ncbi:PepSY domain-containing protein [Nitrolancea hollandica]|uniref:PepSY domain-containing protein n=1 Tax=Nitrolancea hollandica Lb TaxID=1129897 RepID=I4EKC5_9BACT|nr:PepSY domain-containing protein [Nitrolancea hollandica]CCF85137.1 hypothetical protein NITHO_4520003 [Nitrolancea hollandica Lb]
MKNQEEYLDRFIDALNAEENPVLTEIDDAELESLLETTVTVRHLREPEWPDSDFPKVLSARLAHELSTQRTTHTSSLKTPNAIPTDGRGQTTDRRRILEQHDRPNGRDTRRWLRQGLELVAGIVFLAILTGIMVTMLESQKGVPESGQTRLEPAGEVTTPPVTPVVTAPGRPVTLEEAKNQVRAFLEAPDAILTGEASPSYNIIGGQPVRVGTYYIIKRQMDGVRDPDQFTVDGDSGEIIAAHLPSATSDNMPKQPVSEAQANLIVTKFAQTRFYQFAHLTVHDEDHLGGRVGTKGQDRVYQVRWQLRSPESGAWLPTFVWVGVDLETGKVTSYIARRTDYRGPTAPKVNREQAIQIALTEAHKDPDLAGAKVGEVRLEADTVEGKDHVTWFISLDNVPEHALVRHFSVDAITGEIVNPLGSPVG